MKQKHFIDSHKGATFIWVLACMWHYDQWHNTTAWIYLALHGTYGIMWILKSMMFGDRQWEQPTGIAYGLVIWGSLSLYWVAPWIICSFPVHAPPWLLGVAVSIYSLGVFYHFAADMQKHTALSLRKGLVLDGFFLRTRNPNYFGELLIYFGFSVLAMHWLPLVALAAFVCSYWVPNMIRKDRSLSRYPEFAEYKKKSAMLIPFLI